MKVGERRREKRGWLTDESMDGGWEGEMERREGEMERREGG